MPSPGQVTELLSHYRKGDREALAQLIPLVYDELRVIAARHFKNERRDHTLQPTALVHEAYVKLAAMDDPRWENRAQFLACAATVMRHLLVDHARAKRAGKRGGGGLQVTLVEAMENAAGRDVDLVALDEALERLAKLSEREARVVELRCFGGLSLEETAEAMGISSAVVRRDFTLARAFLRRELRSRR